MLHTPVTIRENTEELISEVFNCCPTLVQHQIMDRMQLQTVAANTMFIQPGDKLDGVYIIVEGGVKLYQQHKSRKNVLHYLGHKDIIGLTHVMCSLPINYFAYTMCKTTLAFIPGVTLLKLMDKHPHTFFSLIKKLDEKAKRVEDRGIAILADSAEQAVIQAVNDLESRFGIDNKGYIRVHIPVKELATYVGMSKTNLYRVLQTLKEKSILSHHLDKYKLEKNQVC